MVFLCLCLKESFLEREIDWTGTRQWSRHFGDSGPSKASKVTAQAVLFQLGFVLLERVCDTNRALFQLGFVLLERVCDTNRAVTSEDVVLQRSLQLFGAQGLQLCQELLLMAVNNALVRKRRHVNNLGGATEQGSATPSPTLKFLVHPWRLKTAAEAITHPEAQSQCAAEAKGTSAGAA